MHGVVVHTCTKFSPIGSLKIPPSYVRGRVRAPRRGINAPVEHGVERRDFIHPHRLHFEQLRHIVHNADARPSFVLPLAEVEEWDDGCLFVLWRVMRDDFIGAFKILGCELEWNLEGVRQYRK
jgi:hypothetical protein